MMQLLSSSTISPQTNPAHPLLSPIRLAVELPSHNTPATRVKRRKACVESPAGVTSCKCNHLACPKRRDSRPTSDAPFEIAFNLPPPRPTRRVRKEPYSRRPAERAMSPGYLPQFAPNTYRASTPERCVRAPPTPRAPKRGSSRYTNTLFARDPRTPPPPERRLDFELGRLEATPEIHELLMNVSASRTAVEFTPASLPPITPSP